MAAQYHPRAIEQTFGSQASHQVVILEGRRAVGKSSLARHLVERGIYASYQSLAEPSVAEWAREDPMRWVRSLKPPAVIDEAQIVPQVSIAVKEVVDTLPSGSRFMLTGSASVGRGTMAGSDPLVGRASRIGLNPFTSLELASGAEGTPSLIDQLFDADVRAATFQAVTLERLITIIRTGGIPSYALSSYPLPTHVLRQSVAADALAILGDQILPEEHVDAGLGLRVLDAVLRIPGGQLKQTRIAQELGIDDRTVGRYLRVLERRFLLRRLPNLRVGASGAGRAAPKVHAVDTSSNCESLSRAGHDIAASPELLGQVLETWVINQFLAAQGWAEQSTDAFYWRDNKTQREVDLALVDGRDRRVGIEVKLASAIAPSDLRGLQAMRSHGGLHRGFIVYTGTRCEQISEDIWSLPVSCLISPENLAAMASGASRPGKAFSSVIPVYLSQSESESVVSDQENESIVPIPSVFLSYVHDDDEYLDGLLVAFAEQVRKACSFHGTDIQLITDKAALKWGDNWREQLEREVERTTFLLAMVTPKYVRSAACQEEFLQFRAKTATAGYNGLLTLLVLKPDWDAPVLAGNQTVEIIRQTVEAHQWLEPSISFEDLQPDSQDFKKVAREVAEALMKRIHERNDSPRELPASGRGGKPANGEDGLIEVLERLQGTRIESLRSSQGKFIEAFNKFGKSFSSGLSSIPRSGLPSSKSLVQLAHDIKPDQQTLDEATKTFSQAWRDFDADIKTLSELVSEAEDAEMMQQLRESFEALPDSLRLPGLEDVESTIRQLAGLSRSLRPAAQVLDKAVGVVRSIRSSAEAWLDALPST